MSRAVRAEHLRKGDVLADGRRIRGRTITWPESRYGVVLLAGTGHDFGYDAKNLTVHLDTEFEVENFGFEAKP